MGGGRVVLIGLPGVGKTSVAARLAPQLGLPHVDLDALIAQQAGMAVGELLRREGEAAFRMREAELLDRVLQGPEAVISAGGGAAAFYDGIQRMRARGQVVWLDAPVDVLAERVLLDPEDRPLLGETRQAVRASLLALQVRRQPLYAQAHLHVAATAPLAQVAEAVRANLDAATEPEGAALAGHPVVVHGGAPAAAADRLAALAGGGRVVLVIDRGVAAWARPLHEMLAARGVAVHAIEVPGGERGKDLRGAAKLWSAFATAGAGRGDLVVAVGGGATTDLAGFCAATWQRGVRWAALPTTVLAMADASVGGKTAVDLAEGKNLVGAFHMPSLVWLPLQTLGTLPARQFRAGLAEVAKVFLLADAAAWRALLDDATALRRRSLAALRPHLEAAIRIKARIVAQDPREQGGAAGGALRALLNLGHTVGHAIEAESRYAVLHGEAVAMGLVAEAEWAESAGQATAGTARAVRDGLQRLGLDTGWERWCGGPLAARMGLDKKRDGDDLVLPALATIGSARLVRLPLALLQATLAALAGPAGPLGTQAGPATAGLAQAGRR